MHGHVPNDESNTHGDPEMVGATERVGGGGASSGAQGRMPPWVGYAAAAGILVLTAAVSAVVTLAVTQETARTENLKAYLNGISDALDAVRDGAIDPWDYVDLVN